ARRADGIPRARPASPRLGRRGVPHASPGRHHDDARPSVGARVGAPRHRRTREHDRVESMSARLLTAKEAQAVRDAAMAELKQLASPPKVVAVHNPESPAARYYMRAQKKTCAEAGVAYEVRALEPGWTQAKIVELIRELNRDPKVSGITVHTPLPAGVDQD